MAAERPKIRMVDDKPENLKSEENFKRLVETMNEGVLMVSLDEKIRYANKSFYEMLGYKEPELAGKNYAGLFVINTADSRLLYTMVRLRKKGVGTSYRLQMKKKNGSLIWVEISGVPILDHQGLVIGTMGVHSNVTERKKMEDDLQESTERFMSIFNQAAVGISQIGINGKFLHVNDQMTQIFGYDKDEFARLTFFDITHPEDQKLTREVYDKFVQGQRKEVNIVKRYLHKDGRVIHINIYANLVKIGRREPYFVTIYNDISKRMEAENNVVKALSEGQEKERKRIAQDLHDGLGQSLSGIKMHLHLIQPGEKDTSKLEAVRSLIDDAIREYRAVSHNLMPPVLEESGLIEALAELCEKMKATAPLQIAFSHCGDCKDLTQNVKTGLYRITQEVINNTLKHAQATKLHIRVTRKNSVVVLEIEDDGIGFDVDQAEQTGSGIGLKNLYTRAKSMNGRVAIRSAPAKGTYINIEIPQ